MKINKKRHQPFGKDWCLTRCRVDYPWPKRRGTMNRTAPPRRTVRRARAAPPVASELDTDGPPVPVEGAGVAGGVMAVVHPGMLNCATTWPLATMMYSPVLVKKI